MQRCPNCDFDGKSLRKHFDKFPQCKTMWLEGIKRYETRRDEAISESSVASSPGEGMFEENSTISNFSVIYSEDNSTVKPSAKRIHGNDSSDSECSVEETVPVKRLSGNIDSKKMGFSIDQYCETELLKILNDKQAPHGMYQQVLEWSCRAKRMRYSFEPSLTKRSTHVRHLTEWQAQQNRRPFQKDVLLPDLPTLNVQVTCYDFKTELLSLLSSPTFASSSNLDVIPSNPFGKYESSTGRLNCFNAGHWYQKSYDRICVSGKDLFVPIIFSFDESNLADKNSSIAPLKFTTSLLNQHSRNREENWRTLCFIPDLNAFESAADRKKQTPSTKSKRLHSLFRAGMESYLCCEQDLSLLSNTSLSLGGMTKYVNLKVACALVLGDVQGGDKICCRSATYRNTVNRICRKCNIPGSECSNLDYSCKKVSMTKIKKLVLKNDLTRLDKYNQHCVKSIWYELNYGGCKFGVFSAANPTEWLHALDNGLIEHCLHELYTVTLSNERAVAMDKLVKQFLQMPRQRLMSSDSNSAFPRLLWKNGITRLTDVTADYKVGMLLTIIVVSLTDEGKKLFREALGGVIAANGMQKAFQHLLAYRSWLRKKEFWTIDDSEGPTKAKAAIQKCLNYLKTYFPRTQGQGWNIPKFHEQLHVPDDIKRNGPPSVTFSGVVEHQHVTSKKHATRTRKHLATLDKELGNRLHETIVINESYAMMKASLERLSEDTKKTPDANEEPKLKRNFVNPCKCTLQHDGTVTFESNNDNVLKDSSNNGLAFLLGEWKLQPGDTFYLFSEIRCDKMIYRANKTYWSSRSHGWHDWVMMRFAAHDNSPKFQRTNCKVWFGDEEDIRIYHEYAPGRILAFVSKLKPKEITDVSEEVFAIMETCDFKHQKSSMFTTRWTAASMYVGNSNPSGKNRRRVQRLELVNPSHFVGHCLMIPQDKDNTVFHQLWYPELWADEHHKDC